MACMSGTAILCATLTKLVLHWVNEETSVNNYIRKIDAMVLKLGHFGE